MTKEGVISFLRLPPDTDSEASFRSLGVRLYDLVDLRNAVESRLFRRIPDDVWLELNCIDDILRL